MAEETDIIARSSRPVTGADIQSGLSGMGLAPGDVVLMHTSLSALGWVCGGVQTVLEAVTGLLGDTGTLVMPGFSSQLTDPANWNSPSVPKHWIEPIRAHMPVFDPQATPVRGIGQVAETFRALAGTRRSYHPIDSFLARGPAAEDLLSDHPLNWALGPTSPLGRLYDADAKVLLLGADYGSCTCFHLAEYMVADPVTEIKRLPVAKGADGTLWQDVEDVQSFEEIFSKIGASFDAEADKVTRGFDGAARLFSVRDAVDHARLWFEDGHYAKLARG